MDALTEEEVASVVRFVVENEGDSGVEMMKPFKMAEVSPRIFWSIARLNKDGDGDVITNGTRHVGAVRRAHTTRLNLVSQKNQEESIKGMVYSCRSVAIP